MDKEGHVPELYLTLRGRGVSDGQLDEIAHFCETSSAYIFPQSTTVELGSAFLLEKLQRVLNEDELTVVKKLVDEQLADHTPELIYGETGYDSSQANRETAKIVSQLLSIGGLIYEGELLGLKASVALHDLDQTIRGFIHDAGITRLTRAEGDVLAGIAAKLGSQQDFLFPGVTPSDETTPSLEEMALSTLAGKPPVSVRSVVGVGGLRFDKEWNYLADFASFAMLKIAEDKRYYPGLAAFYLMAKTPWENIPVLDTLWKNYPNLYYSLGDFVNALFKEPRKLQGYSLMCSGYMPRYREWKYAKEAPLAQEGVVGEFLTSLAIGLHSPSHEFDHWFEMVKEMSRLHATGSFSELSFVEHFEAAKKWSKGLWTFNSPIHLPWTSELSHFSHGLIGKIKSKDGGWAVRYGLGSSNSQESLEVRVYSLPGGSVSIRLISYEGCLFSAQVDDEWIFSGKHPFIARANEVGFLQAAVEQVER